MGTAIKKIKKNLWSWGVSVKDAPVMEDYDLIVKQKYRVKVILANHQTAMNRRMEKNCDVLAVFVPSWEGREARLYAKPSGTAKNEDGDVKIFEHYTSDWAEVFGQKKVEKQKQPNQK